MTDFHASLDAARERAGFADALTDGLDEYAAKAAANSIRDDLAARIVHRLTCSRCRMGWTCGGLGADDFERGAEIAGLVAEARAAALREAADEARERGDIGRADCIEVWDWLDFRAESEVRP